MAIQGSRPNNKIILIAGIICAVLAFAGVLFLLRQGSSSTSTSPAVVAKTPIKAGTPITADQVEVTQLPADRLPADVAVDTSTVTGHQLTVDVTPNTPITNSIMVASSDNGGGTSTGGTTAPSVGRVIVDKGQVALAIPSSATPVGTGLTGLSSDLLSVGNYIQAGDHVDILIDTGDGHVRYGFQDVTILKVGTSGSAATAVPTVYIVELPRAQAEVLTYLVTHNNVGNPALIKYVLRSRTDTGYLDAGQPNIPNKQDVSVTAGTLNQLFPH